MKAVKLTKDDKVLYVVYSPWSYTLAIEFGWKFETVEVATDTILNNWDEIGILNY